jgi:hypothetical protein
MGALYSSLSFPSDMNSKVKKYDENTKKHMESVKVTNKDEYDDVLGNKTDGYYTNPVGNSCNTITSTVNTITTIAGVPNSINIAASDLITSTFNFFRHTQRLSGLEPQLDETTAGKPTLDLALNVGRQLSYILYQTEGIDDNSVTLGSFSSLYTKDNLTSYITTISTYPTIIQNSIVTTVDPGSGDGGGGGGYSYSSNLTSTQITQITTKLNDIGTFMDNKRTSDENFYTKSSRMVDKFGNANGITSKGATHKQLVSEVIGTDTAKSRVNA